MTGATVLGIVKHMVQASLLRRIISTSQTTQHTILQNFGIASYQTGTSSNQIYKKHFQRS